MESNVREERIKIFRQELYTLENEGCIPGNIVEIVAKAHHQYHLNLLQQETIQSSTSAGNKNAIHLKPDIKKPQKVKKPLTPEEIRERNIIWSLNIGVIFLLIGGLFVATSNWQSMSSMLKCGLIAMVSLLFYGLSLLTKKVLHINKTAFAFTVLGSLFVPIFILSLGSFGFLGTYLSINGEGKYFLGTLGSLVPILVYIWFAHKLDSRLFVWFTYISFTAGIAFFLAGLQLSMDSFYLGLMLLNVIYLVLYHFTKNRMSIELFTKEFVPFVQVNLVLSTLFMLFLYDNQLAYSFNLFLTAIIYLSMIYVSGKKEYHFVFSVMLVYAAYQLFEHSNLKTFAAIGYALTGVGVVFVPRLFKGEFSLDKAFQYTSAVISGFAFIYISFEGMVLRTGGPSIVLMIAYFVVAANFIYLSNNVPLRLFPYLSSAFLASALYEAAALVLTPIHVIHFPVPMFLAGLLLFLMFGTLLITTKHVKNIQLSARDIGLGLMGLAVFTGFAFSYWRELGVMLFLLLPPVYFMSKNEHRMILKEAAIWILPSSLGLSVTAFGEEIISRYPNYYDQCGESINFTAGAIVVLLSCIGWKKGKEVQLTRASMYVSQVLYSISMVYAIGGPINLVWLQPLIFILGIGMYAILYKSVCTKWVPILISTAALLSYYSVFHSIMMKIELNQIANALILTTGSVLMLVIAYLFLKKDSLLANAFAWTGHVIYPLTLEHTYFAFHDVVSLCSIPAILVYGLSTRFTKAEWKIKVYLYGSFTSLLFVISTSVDRLGMERFGYYVFPITSTLIFIFYIFASPEFRKRTAYYLVPFSFIGVISVLMTYPFSWQPFLVIIVYTVSILFYLHKINWDLLVSLPLFLAFLATVEFLFVTGLNVVGKFLLTGGIGVITAAAGLIIYKHLINGRVLRNLKVDAFTAISFLYFWLMYFFENNQIWTHILPGILISALILLQTTRVPKSYSLFMTIIGAVYILQPYYSMIIELDIPSIWGREVIVLPWIALVIFFRIKLKGKYSMITKPLEWGILLIVSLLLVQDGLSSSTIYDAIILGSLSLISMLFGMVLQIKSYFFVGSSVLLLNVFLQTRPYWGNMPWWGYLLIVGFILITVASFNEWHKQKLSKGESTFIINLKNKTINKLMQWD